MFSHALHSLSYNQSVPVELGHCCVWRLPGVARKANPRAEANELKIRAGVKTKKMRKEKLVMWKWAQKPALVDAAPARPSFTIFAAVFAIRTRSKVQKGVGIHIIVFYKSKTRATVKTKKMRNKNQCYLVWIHSRTQIEQKDKSKCWEVHFYFYLNFYISIIVNEKKQIFQLLKPMGNSLLIELDDDIFNPLYSLSHCSCSSFLKIIKLDLIGSSLI